MITREDLDRKYDELLFALCRLTNFEREPTRPLHFYAMAVDQRWMAVRAQDIALELDRTRAFLDQAMRCPISGEVCDCIMPCREPPKVDVAALDRAVRRCRLLLALCRRYGVDYGQVLAQRPLILEFYRQECCR